MKLIGVDVGSTTVKAVAVDWRAAAEGEASESKEKSRWQVVWQDYQRHNTRQAEKVVEFLRRMETEAGLSPGADRVFFRRGGEPHLSGKLHEVGAVRADGGGRRQTHAGKAGARRSMG